MKKEKNKISSLIYLFFSRVVLQLNTHFELNAYEMTSFAMLLNSVGQRKRIITQTYEHMNKE